MNLENILETIRLLTVQVETDREKGTGVLIVQNGRAYVVTVYHCIYGKAKSPHNVQRNNITFRFDSKVTTEEIKPLSIALYREKIVLLEVEIARLRVEDVENLILLDRVYYDKSYHLRGYPKGLSHGHFFEAKCKDKSLDDIGFSIEVNSLTEDTSGDDIIESVAGLSGSGVFFSENGRLYLVGLVNSLATDGGLFNIVYAVKLIDLKEADIELSQYQNSSLLKFIRAKEEKLIYSTTPKSKQIYINRDIDALLSNRIAQKKGCVLFLHGQGGIGKSTLLDKFSQTDRSTIFIHINESIEMSMVDIFLDEGKTTVRNCPKFETKLDEIFAQKEKDNKIQFTAESELLQVLKEDFGEHGIFIVDTFEKNKNSRVKSRIKFDEDTIKFRRIDYYQPFKDYLEELVYKFVSHTTFIIAGRNRIDDVMGDRDKKYLDLKEVEEIALERFSTEAIEEYIQEYGLDKPTIKELLDIGNLTYGNPLLVSLLVKVVSDYGGWSKLDYSEMKKIVEEDKNFGLIYYFTKRIASHIEIEDIWRLIIPRVLTIEIEKLLFEQKNIFEKLVDEGLIYRGRGKDRNLYMIHDDVAIAIKSYAKKELGSLALASWHDRAEVREVHQRLVEFYGACDEMYGVNGAFEGCYHKIMSKEGFEGEFEVLREEFTKFFLGALGLSLDRKMNICQNWNDIENHEIKEYIKNLKDEKDRANMSSELYDRFSIDLALGNVASFEDIDYLKKISKNNKFKNDWSIFWLLGIAYDKKNNYNQAIVEYQNAIKINPKKDKVYYNLGNTYMNTKKYYKAIESFQKAVKINPKKDEAYYNMGNIYFNNKEYDKAITVYQKAVEINPAKDEAYGNLGSTYFKKEEYNQAIEEYQKAIAINPNNYKAYYNMNRAYTYIFELQLTQNQPFDQALEKKYIELFQNQKETFIHYEMLKILQDIAQNQEVEIEGWVQKYRGVELDWSFDELREWIDGVEEGEIKERLIEAVGVFKGHL